jgi:23S rRNA-/tRNA-specific pseudouridylate synthase
MRRLDKDTSGLLLLTTQTDLVHQYTSPKRKEAKEYVARLANAVKAEQQEHMVRPRRASRAHAPLSLTGTATVGRDCCDKHEHSRSDLIKHAGEVLCKWDADAEG